ncbi:hypothetical protein K8I31_04755 [bacterium]|nr:hypothetical protein [bacterium]
MDRVEVFLDKVMAAISDRVSINPNQLVRVMHKGKVVWMTQEQAVNYLDQGESGSLVNDVQMALKADLKIIRQELEILLALATYTVKKYKEQEAISSEEIARIEPSLGRRQYEISDGVTQTAQSEALLQEKRRRNPMLDEYEDMMGQFLNEKAKGNMDEALRLARVLAERKKKYILLSRAIEPDIRTIQYHRLNLQKTKKRILNTQNDICSTRIDALQIELNDLQTSINQVKSNTADAEERGMDSASAEISKLRIYDIEETKKEIEQKATELSTLEKESSILERQEQEVDAVISHIAENILGEVDAKVDMEGIKAKQEHKQMSTPKNAPAPDDGGGSAKKSSTHGMHFKR